MKSKPYKPIKLFRSNPKPIRVTGKDIVNLALIGATIGIVAGALKK